MPRNAIPSQADSGGSVPERAKPAAGRADTWALRDPVYNSADPGGSRFEAGSLVPRMPVARERPRPAEPAGQQRPRIAAQLAKAGRPIQAAPGRYRSWRGRRRGATLFLQALDCGALDHPFSDACSDARRPRAGASISGLLAGRKRQSGSAVDLRHRHAARARGAGRHDRVRHGNGRRARGRRIARTYAGMDDGRRKSRGSDKLAGAGCGRRPDSGVLPESASQFRGRSLAPQSGGTDSFGHLAGLRRPTGRRSR